MTRQMADDEVLRVFRRDAELAASARAKESTDYSRNRAHESESAIAAVAALQAERDALRAGHGVPRVVDALHLSTGRVVTAEEFESLQMNNLNGWRLALGRGVQLERAESALEALRGQVAGLVALLTQSRELALQHNGALVLLHVNDEGRAHTEALIRELDAELLAIKERMG